MKTSMILARFGVVGVLAGLGLACSEQASGPDSSSQRDASAASTDAETTDQMSAADSGVLEDAGFFPDADTAADTGVSQPDGSVMLDATSQSPDALPMDASTPPSDAAVDGGASNPDAGTSADASASFERITIDGQRAGASWTAVADMNGDGKLDVVVSSFGQIGLSVPAGEVHVLLQGADIRSWTAQPAVGAADGVKFPNLTTPVDIDGDGDLDLVVPGGFLVCTAIPFSPPCGTLGWWEAAPSGWVRHDIIAPGAELFYHHAEVVDFDGDGILDVVTVGEAKGSGFGGMDRAVTQWFKGTQGANRFESMPREVGNGLGSIPAVRDVDGDGDLDVLGAEFFVSGESFAWFERTSSQPLQFQKHVIDDASGPAIMLAWVPNLYGDGVQRALGTNHVNTAKNPPDPQAEAVIVLTPPADPRQHWTKSTISSGIQSVPGSRFAPQAAPGIFAYGDLDGDGDLDVVVSGDGDPRVLWLEQLPGMQWAQHVLEAQMPQAGGLNVVDLDGDGRAEIVLADYSGNAVYVYRRR